MNKSQELNVQVNVLEIANSSNSIAVKHTTGCFCEEKQFKISIL